MHYHYFPTSLVKKRLSKDKSNYEIVEGQINAFSYFDVK